MSNSSRRQFLAASAAAGLSTLAAPALLRGASSPNETITLGVMGTNGRGLSLVRSFAGLKNCEFKYVCDVDERARLKGEKALQDAQPRTPESVTDYRKMLDDADVDAIVIAAPDHWHAVAGIAGCQAGKHVYVEKPCSHNAAEGEMFMKAAADNKRQVQMGTQRRSRPGIREGIARLHEGLIGDVLYARCHYYNARGNIGHGKQVPVPTYLNWDLWQGPAPVEEYRDNLVHYNWHWFWNWGTAELGNNGVHYLDVLRWGMGADYPTRVSCDGAKLRHDDDQQTPDTSLATYHFGDKFVTWEQRSWAKKTKVDPGPAMAFFGTKGSLEIANDSGYRAFDLNGKEIATGEGASGDADHLQNFLDAIRGEAELNCDIQTAHRSTLLCHLGNIAYRVGRPLEIDPTNGHIVDDSDAMALWGREYNPAFAPKV
ncbi:MAG: dehydrogenase [Planctomyces sp.]|nr:dehydrogenase [Planctomyces sp.]